MYNLGSCNIIWLFKVVSDLKVTLQSLQRCSLSDCCLWILKWDLRFDIWRKSFPQSSQGILRFTFECFRITWPFNSCFERKAKPQSEQTKFLIPAWMSKWDFSATWVWKWSKIILMGPFNNYVDNFYAFFDYLLTSRRQHIY